MAWTENHGRRKSNRRHRPLLELLDDRCLLSTSAGVKLNHQLASHALVRRHAPVGHHGETAHRAERAGHKMGHDGARLRELERPAGTIETGASTAYDPIIGASQVRSTYQVQGTGMAVAVIDTGVDYNNSALGGGFGPNNKVIAGYDFADNSANPMATSSQHGTAVAGLIGSDDPSDLGVAPGVNIVALRVTDSTNTGTLNSVASALQWVVNNHSEYNITSVNMSLSDSGNYAGNWFANDGGAGQQITELIGQLSAMNIPVIAATGNSFTGQQGEGFAAIVAGTISVTATDLSGNLLSNAQRLGTALGGSSATTIAAPGEGLTAPSGASGTSTVEGTSFATALVTGGVTLLQNIYLSRFGSLPTVAQLKDWIQESATQITDPVTGITIGELDLPAAAALVPGASHVSAPTVTSSPVTTTSSAPSSTTTTSTPTPTPTTSTSVTTTHPTTSSSSQATGSATTSNSSATATTTTSTSSSTTTTAQTTTTVTTTAPSSPVTTTATTSSTTSGTASASSLQVFVNGQEITSSQTTPAAATGPIDLSSIEELLAAMSVWHAGSSSASGQSSTQVQIWNA